MAVNPVGTDFPDWRSWLLAVTRALNRVINGELSVVGSSVTLTANAATTEVIDARSGAARAILLQPTTANAAAALATTYIDPAEVDVGAFTINHANNAQTDKTFRYIIIG